MKNIQKGIIQLFNTPNLRNIIIINLILLCFGLLTFNKSFPLAEGWYSLFAKEMQMGKLPYRDFEYLYFPWYLYTIYLFVAVFGLNFIYLRILGIFVFMAIGTCAYLILAKRFNSFIALVCAISLSFYLQSEAPQVFYDYVRFFDLAVLLSTLFIAIYIKNIQKKRYLLLTGLFSTISILIKQSNGLIIYFYILCFIIFFFVLSKNAKKLLSALSYFFVGSLIPITILLIALISTNSLSPFISMTTGGAINAKGGMGAILFAAVGRTFNSLKITRFENFLFLILVSLIVVFIIKNFNKFRNTDKDDNKLLNYLSLIFSSSFFLILIIAYLSYNFNNFLILIPAWNTTLLFFLVVSAVFIYLAIRYIYLFFKKIDCTHDFHLVLFSGLGFSLGYACMTSGGLSEAQTAFSLALVFALILEKLSQYKYKRITLSTAMTVCLIFPVAGFARKFKLSYGWWGLTEGPIHYATETINVPYLGNIKVSENTKYIIEDITKKIIENTNENDHIYIFPQVVIFYLTTNRYPITKSLVPWFDVSSQETVREDFELLKNNLPKALVIIYISEYTMTAHENAFNNGQKSVQREMYEYFDEITSPRLGVYQNYGYYDLASDTNYISEAIFPSYPLALFIKN